MIESSICIIILPEPIHLGKNQAGMQAKEELEQPHKIRLEQQLWAEINLML